MSRSRIRSTLAVVFAAAAALAFSQPAGAGTDATTDVTTFSVAQLNSVKADLDRTWTKVPASVASWYVDEATNRVVVEVVRNDKAGVAFAKSGINSAAITTKSVDTAYTPYWSIIGGQAIYTGGARCSAGFNARRSDGTRLVITAGHCTNIGSTWTGVGGALGSRYGSSFPGNDYGSIRVTSSSAVSTALVDRYSAGSDVTVSGAANPALNTRICRSGSTTGWRCGTVTGLNQTVNYGSSGIVYGLIRTNACAEPGDSGGSMVSNTSPRVTAYGLTSGGSGNCSSGGTTFFQPIVEALNAYGASIYTG
ncbi:MAG TPA: S1 family peptidase [Pseudonocardiaceae bacterium]